MVLLSGRSIIDSVNLLGRSRTLFITSAPAGQVGLSLLVSACGGSPGSRVAQPGSTTATTKSSPTSTTRASSRQHGAVAFSRCMRSHGVPAYPDPGSGGVIPKQTPPQVGVSPSEFQAAERACIHLVANGAQPAPAQVQEYRNTMLIYARCIRAHGVSNMSDPDNRGRLDIGPGTGVDVNGPEFQAAFQACKSRLSP